MESAAIHSSEVHEVDSKTYPSFLTLKEGSTFLTKPLFNSLFDPFGSPYRGQKPSGTRGCNRPTRCSEPLRSKVGGPSKVFAMLCGLGPPEENLT